MSGGSYLLLVVCGSLLLDSAFGTVTWTTPALGVATETLAEDATTIYTEAATTDGSGAVTFAISSQTPTGIFTIVATSGVISLVSGQKLDFETAVKHTVILVATDDGDKTDTGTITGTVTITVTDTNDNSPVFGETSYCATVATSAVVDTSVGVYTATDADAGTTLTYSIEATGNTGTKFQIGSDAIVKTAATFATTDPTTYILILRATDTGATNTGSTTVTVNRDVSCNAATNDNSPVFGETSYCATVATSAVVDTSVGVYTATDADASTTLTYSIDATGNTGTKFQIGSDAIVKTAATFATTDPTTYILILRATDTGATNTGSTTVTVNRDVSCNAATNDNSPVFGETSYCATVATSAVVDTSVGVYTATDADASTTLTYSIDATGNTGTKFQIGTDANLKTAATFATTDPTTYTLIVRATDTGAINTGSTTVTVNRDGSCSNAAQALDSVSMATGVTLMLLLSKIF